MVRKVKEKTKANLIQAGHKGPWWPYATTHFTFSRRVAIEDGESVYNRRHQQGHCKAKQVPYGALVDYLPTPSPAETKRAKSFEPKTRDGLLVGFHVQPGGLWSGDYLVADWETFRHHPDATPGQCRIHRTSAVFWDPTKVEFPLAEFRTVER